MSETFTWLVANRGPALMVAVAILVVVVAIAVFMTAPQAVANTDDVGQCSKSD